MNRYMDGISMHYDNNMSYILFFTKRSIFVFDMIQNTISLL